jgi:Spy/CpxP family protein refolding chaperone
MFKSRWSKVLGMLSLAALLAGFAGCDKPSVNGANDDESDVASAESELGQPEPMRHGPPGPGMLLGAALHELDLTDAQKATIKGELDGLRSAADDHHGEREAMHKALAAAVRSGSVDEAAFSQKLGKEPGDPARLAKALGVLHETLTAAQRRQLVDAISAKMEKHGKRGERGERGGKHEREHGAEMGGPMGHMLHGLDLTDAQRTAIREAMQKNAPSEADRAAMKGSHDAFRKGMRDRLETFAGGSFDASAFAAAPAGAKMGPKGMFGGMVKMLATVTPILTETQREALATRIEEGPAGAPHAGKSRGHRE